MENMNIFEVLYKNYKITKPLRLIEFFAGYGSQALALKYLGVDFEYYKICEWAVNSIIAYASLHRNELEEYGNNFCGDLTKEQIASELFSMGVSINYNEPAKLDQLKRMNGEMKDLQQNNLGPTLDTRADCLGIVVSKKEKNYSQKSLEKIVNNIVDEDGVSGALTATGMQSINHDDCQLVKLKRGYSVEVKPETKDSNDVDYIGNYSKSNYNQTSIVGKNGVSPTVTENHGQVTAISDYNENNDLYIRKLTSKECFRLMGLKDKDIDLISEKQSTQSLYHLAGDSIVTTCLMAILGQLFDIGWKTKFKPEEWWKND